MKKILTYIYYFLLILKISNLNSQSIDTLNVKVKQLDSVVVTALKNNRIIANGKITYKIENSFLVNLGFGSDVIRNIPELQYDGEKIKMKQRSVTLIVDGFQVNNIANSVASALSAIGSNEIERIEIISIPKAN